MYSLFRAIGRCEPVTMCCALVYVRWGAPAFNATRVVGPVCGDVCDAVVKRNGGIVQYDATGRMVLVDDTFANFAARAGRSPWEMRQPIAGTWQLHRIGETRCASPD